MRRTFLFWIIYILNDQVLANLFDEAELLLDVELALCHYSKPWFFQLEYRPNRIRMLQSHRWLLPFQSFAFIIKQDSPSVTRSVRTGSLAVSALTILNWGSRKSHFSCVWDQLSYRTYPVEDRTCIHSNSGSCFCSNINSIIHSVGAIEWVIISHRRSVLVRYTIARTVHRRDHLTTTLSFM